MKRNGSWHKKLKKSAAVLLSGLFSLLAVTGCGEAALPYRGYIVDVTETGIYFVPAAEEGVPDGIGSLTSVGFQDRKWTDGQGNTVTIADLTPGMEIRYNCNGVMETWPASLSGCERVLLTGTVADVSSLAAEWAEWNEANAPEPDPYELPTLQLLYGNEEVSSCAMPNKGTMSWYNGDSALMQDSAHPLHWEDEHLITIYPDKGQEIELNFAASARPDSVEILCWPTDQRDEKTIPDGMTVNLSDELTFTVSANRIYQITAVWEDEEKGGTVSWGFMTLPAK